VPEPFNTLGYDQYRDVQFRGDRSFWINEKRGFALDLLHAGFIYEMPVEINVVEDGIVKPVTYDPGFFDFAGLPLPSWPGAPLFSGIRLR